MIPFCRTLKEADKVLEVMAVEGLVRSDDFQVYVMCEIPSNVILAKEFAKRFDGFSIGKVILLSIVSYFNILLLKLIFIYQRRLQ
jgi:phosphoenolpyruvate synthase/pyruvate phosphate dikinase